MHQLFILVCLGMLLTNEPLNAGERSRTTKQQFVVRVKPKVVVQSQIVFHPPAASSTSEGNSSSPQSTNEQITKADETVDAVINVAGSGALLVQFETRATHEFRLRLTPAAGKNWRIGEKKKRCAQSLVRTSSSGIGPATLILSTSSHSEDIEIIATVISKN